MKNLSVYIHVPFCKSKCTYCAFTSFDHCQEDQIEKYFEYLIKEIMSYQKLLKERQLKTIYIGGGTPSVVDARYIDEAIQRLKEQSHMDHLTEVTIEINPGTITEEKLKVYHEIGINRLSFGLQSANDDLLKLLGRVHDFETFKNNILLARTLGFNNISADIIFGIPGQQWSDLEHTLAQLIALNLNHISAYSLTIEEDTPLFNRMQNNTLQATDEAYDRQLYQQLINKLTANGYQQYEISNFSKPGDASQHNLVYWEHGDYLGLGLSAHGFIDGERYGNEETFEDYYQKIDAKQLPRHEKEALTQEELLFERIILNLRLTQGINIQQINQAYTIDFLKKYRSTIDDLIEQKMAVLEKGRLYLTTKGLSLSNKIFIEFMD